MLNMTAKQFKRSFGINILTHFLLIVYYNTEKCRSMKNIILKSKIILESDK